MLVTEALLARLHVVVEHARRRARRRRRSRARGRARAHRPRRGSTTCTTRSSTHAARRPVVDTFRAWTRRVPARVPGRRRAPATRSPTSTCSSSLDPAGDLADPARAADDDGVARHQAVPRGRRARALRRDAGARAPRRHGGRRAPVRDLRARRSPRWIYSFGVAPPPATRSPIPTTQARVAELFLGVWAGTIENDGLNRLVLRAGLDVARRRDRARARASTCARPACASPRPTSPTRSPPTPTRRACSCELLPRPPRSRPCVGARRPRCRRSELDDELGRTIDAVASLDDDRILRALSQSCAPAVRTNAYRGERARGAASSTRRRSTSSPPAPAARDLGVLAAVEGVHLRAGDIARGGIRWSDRREDFRTEILGLMKAQTREERGHRAGRREGRVRGEARRHDAVAATQTFIRGLLDLTDNRVDGRGRAARPRRAARRRRPLPRRRGRQGHRRVLRRRQRARRRVRLLARRRVRVGRVRGLRPQGDGHHVPGRVDLGAGALPRRSASTPTPPASPSSASATCRATCSATVCCARRTCKLVAAFDHRHVFLDPDPDPAASFAERQRLFALADVVVGRLRPRGDLGRWRRVPARRQVGRSVARGAAGARSRRPSRSPPTSW